MIKYIRVLNLKTKRWYTYKTAEEFDKFIESKRLDVTSEYFRLNYRVIIKHTNKNYEQTKLNI